MSQIFPTSPQVIFDTLMADATVLSYLGNYEFAAGVGPVPACSIMTPGQDLPKTRSVTGVEVIIHDIADFRRRDYLTDSPDLETNWKVFVICWDPATGSEMTGLIRRMMQIFSGATTFQTVATADGIGAMVQSQVVIPSDFPIIS